MTRAVAKIQVQMGTSDPDVTGGFTAENVRYKIYDAVAGGIIIPDASFQGKTQSTPGQSSPEYYYLLQKEGATNAQINAYIHEYPTSTQISTGGPAIGNKEFHKDRQHIILEKMNGSKPTTYYRLDFHDALTYIDTKRNHHYLFTIRKVRSEGYESIDEAHYYPGSNIEYTIEEDGGSKSIISNGQYAIITSVDTAYMTTGAVAASVIVTARYTLPQGLTASSITNSISVTSATPAGSLAISGITALSATDGNINISVTPAFDNGTITLKLGNITHLLPVKRKP